MSQRPLSTYTFWISLATNSLLFALCYYFLYPRFGTVDDTEMMLEMSGQMLLPAPQGEVRWSHWGLGYLLAYLYRLNQTVPWYGLMLYAAHFCAMTSLLHVLLKIHGSRWRLFLFVAAFFIAEVPLLQEVQFTSSAIVIAGAGLLLLWWSNRLTTRLAIIVSYTLGLLFFLWGIMIRWEVFQLMAALSIPIFIHAIVHKKTNRILRSAALISVWGLALSLSWLQLYMVQQQAGWRDFYERQQTGIQGAILDYDWEGYRWNEETANIYHSKVGWSYNDYQLYKAWFMADSMVYGTRQFQQIQQLMGERPHYSLQRVKDRLLWFFYLADLPDYWFFCILSIGLGLMLIHFNDLSGLGWALVACLCLTIALLLFLLITRHLPPRVSFPLWWFNLQWVLLMAGLRDGLLPRFKWALAAVWGGLALATLKPVLKDAEQVHTRQLQWDKALEVLNPQPNQLFVSAACRYYEPVALPLRPIFRKPHSAFRALDFGHLANTPTYYKQLQSLGFSNIFLEMIDNERVFFVGAHNSQFMEWYRQYLLEHYRRRIRFEVYKEHPELHTVVFRVLTDTSTQHSQ